MIILILTVQLKVIDFTSPIKLLSILELMAEVFLATATVTPQQSILAVLQQQ